MEWTVLSGNAEQRQAEQRHALDGWRSQGRAITDPLIRVRMRGSWKDRNGVSEEAPFPRLRHEQHTLSIKEVAWKDLFHAE